MRDEAVGFEVDYPYTWTDFHKCVHRLKPQGDYDVEMKILACGVCGSDSTTASPCLPEELPTAVAAPMMGAGLTVYSPLKRNGCGPGAKEDRGTEVSTWTQIENGCLIGASHQGSRNEALEMLRLAADKGEGLKVALERCRKSAVRYRFCLTGYDKEFGEDVKDRED
ncbi:NADP-dependent alcohol dehydrogenase 6 [Diaporthe helianthi]|uniref:NADP-dependent alcohol dehydrogenase 6 n=1 Tax=Diaporthe helianthi TaxID=158607 RepID=A0A2P5HFK7_DIAHE|nr:NADP-dependent alcohol dehydrogenase 6 [Diaporthe helianthi]